MAQAAQALEEFHAQQKKLRDLAREAGRRAKQSIAEADQEIGQLHAEVARDLSTGLGLGARR